jgi:hypothetical protein
MSLTRLSLTLHSWQTLGTIPLLLLLPLEINHPEANLSLRRSCRPRRDSSHHCNLDALRRLAAATHQTKILTVWMNQKIFFHSGVTKINSTPPSSSMSSTDNYPTSDDGFDPLEPLHSPS